MITIRLKPTGTKSRKQWRVVVADRRSARDSRLIEEIGFYNPFAKPDAVQVKMERYETWLRKGAQPTATVRSLIQQSKNKK